jgi:hypothetical protein
MIKGSYVKKHFIQNTYNKRQQENEVDLISLDCRCVRDYIPLRRSNKKPAEPSWQMQTQKRTA